MYFINNILYFDELPHTALHTTEVVEAANAQRTFEPEDMYRYSTYLIAGCHNAFELELENQNYYPWTDAKLASWIEQLFCKQ